MRRSAHSRPNFKVDKPGHGPPFALRRKRTFGSMVWYEPIAWFSDRRAAIRQMHQAEEAYQREVFKR